MADDSSKKKSSLIISEIALLVLLCIICVTALVGCGTGSVYKTIHEEINIELGTEKISVENFIIKNDENHTITLKSDLGAVDLSKTGEYQVEIDFDGKTVKSTVKVVDTTAPTASAVSSVVPLNSNVSPESLVKDVKDFSEVKISYKDSAFLSQAGQHDVVVVLEDTSLNKTEIVVPVTVAADTTPPVIEGVKDLYAEVDGTINYRSGVTVTDDYDKNPKLTVNSDNVDISKEGIYEVTYTATDAAGNTATKVAKVKVTKVAVGNQSNVDQAMDMAETILSTIVTDDMTDQQKVKAIYIWARYNLIYKGSSDKSDYRMAAYTALMNYTGDCYSFFAVTKMMFEILNIPNIDVQKVKNHETDSRHYWSLVSVDGGKTYYHFDATPRKGEGDDFCLVTDAFLDAYSDSHNRCHNRDKSLYPATPTEDLPWN